ncbi:MAG: Mrp family chromosome partitioning ATPase, partial [Planctomycetota bacterium]
KYVIIDAPPLIDHPEARMLLQYADAVVLVLRARETMRADAELAQRIARDSGVEVVGTILNRFRSDLPFGFGERRSA